MQKEGFVSFWVGNIKSSEELDNLLEISYTEDGDFIPSLFARSFDIEDMTMLLGKRSFMMMIIICLVDY